MDFDKPLNIHVLAQIINAEVLGSGVTEVTGLNELHKVRLGDVTFVDHPKYFSRALHSKASVVIINKKVEVPVGKTLLFHRTPFDAFVQLIQLQRPFEAATQRISLSAEIGEKTTIQPGVFIGNHVKIGKNCILHSNVSIYDHCVIGNNVTIHANSVIGGDAYYFQKQKDRFKKFISGGRVLIEDDVEIGALCSIDRGVTSDTIIGQGSKFDNHCQVGHDTIIGKNCLIGAFAAIAGVTVLEDDVVLWANVSINKDIVIGKGAILLSTTGADKSLKGGKIYMGSPAMEARKYWREHVAKSKMPDVIKHLKM